MIRLEDGESLGLRCASIVGAFSCLNGCRDCGSGAIQKSVSRCFFDMAAKHSYQLYVVGNLPLEFIFAGSRVAFAHASVSAMPVNSEKRIL